MAKQFKIIGRYILKNVWAFALVGILAEQFLKRITWPQPVPCRKFGSDFYPSIFECKAINCM